MTINNKLLIIKFFYGYKICTLDTKIWKYCKHININYIYIYIYNYNI